LKDIFELGEIVVFNGGWRIQIDEVERRNSRLPSNYFVYYSTGDTAASTDACYLHKVENGYAFKRRENTECLKKILRRR
jgi:hypothetical protein